VKVLATSREPIAVAGEVVYRVPSLAVDDAVRLFAERAAAVRPSFVLDERTEPAARAICVRVDGLPLAIELAAARVRAMAPAEIAEQLANRMQILSAGRRGALPRQRTLEASVQWSYDLLTRDEQTVLRRLSVFAGGFTLRAAERVVAGDGIDAWQVVDLLTDLVDRSLVHTDDDGERTRYRLLETVRVFAAQRLAEAGEVERMRDRHYHAVFAETNPADLAGLAANVDNVRAALDWAAERANVAAGARLMLRTAYLWVMSFPSEGLLRGKTFVDPGGDDRAAFDAALITAWIALFAAEMEMLTDLADRACAIATALDDDHAVARALTLKAIEYWSRADAVAVTLFPELVEQLERLGDTWGLAQLLGWHAFERVLAGDFAAGRAVSERAVTLAANSGDPTASAMLHVLASGVALMAADLEAVRAHHAASEAALATQAGVGRSMSALTPVWLASARGDHAVALSGMDAMREECRRLGLRIVLGLSVADFAILGWRVGRPWDHTIEREVLDGFPIMRVMVDVFAALAKQSEGGRVEEVDALARLGDEFVRDHPAYPFARPLVRLVQSRARLEAGDAVLADALAHEAFDDLHAFGFRQFVPTSIDLVAATTAAHGDHVGAARLLGASDAVRADIEWVRGVFEIAFVDGLVSQIVIATGAGAYDAARAEGAAMSHDEAIAFVQRGRGKRGRPAFGWSSLTPTEVDVVRLVSEGLRNKEIAEKLLMSPATVKTHLTHVFAKLGITTRTELAAQAATRAPSA
jgi:DNA-binding CsgD family transcriptional regulator